MRNKFKLIHKKDTRSPFKFSLETTLDGVTKVLALYTEKPTTEQIKNDYSMWRSGFRDAVTHLNSAVSFM